MPYKTEFNKKKLRPNKNSMKKLDKILGKLNIKHIDKIIV